MIYVVDNGGDYSDHRLYFVRTDAPLELVEEVCRHIRRSDGDGGLADTDDRTGPYVAGVVAGDLTWLNGRITPSTMTLSDFAHVWDWRWCLDPASTAMRELLAKEPR